MPTDFYQNLKLPERPKFRQNSNINIDLCDCNWGYELTMNFLCYWSLGIPWLDQQLLTSEEVLCYVELSTFAYSTLITNLWSVSGSA